VLDWSSKGFVRGFFVNVFCLWSSTFPPKRNRWPETSGNFSKQILQSWMYYIMGTCTLLLCYADTPNWRLYSVTEDISELTRFTGILRGIESFAQAIAYGLNANKSINSWTPVSTTSHRRWYLLTSVD
jgi:hypothetical protein